MALWGRNALGGFRSLQELADPCREGGGDWRRQPHCFGSSGPPPPAQHPRLQALHLSPRAALVESWLWGQGRAGDGTATPQEAPLPWLPPVRSTRLRLIIARPSPSGLSSGFSWAGAGHSRPSIPLGLGRDPGTRRFPRTSGYPRPGAPGPLPKAGGGCGTGPRAAGQDRGVQGCRFVLAPSPLLFAGAIVSAPLPAPRKRRPVPFPRVSLRCGDAALAHPERWHLRHSRGGAEAAPGPAWGPPPARRARPAGRPVPRGPRCAPGGGRAGRSPVPGRASRRSAGAPFSARQGGNRCLASPPHRGETPASPGRHLRPLPAA